MVISFKEKDRKRIEVTGKNIIQVKQVVYKVEKFFNDIIEENGVFIIVFRQNRE